MTTSDTRTIKSARRVLEILEYFDQDHSYATVMDLARRLSYPQSSTSELLRCMTRLGYLHYNRTRRTYSPTARVALLGTWVRPSLFRGGTMLRSIDELAAETGQTIVVSSACSYVVQHVHVVHGAAEPAAEIHTGDSTSLVDTIQGKLLLSSYSNEQVRSAVHRLNAEESDTVRHVRIAEFLQDLDQLRRTNWAVAQREDGFSEVCVLLPQLRGMGRLVVSVIAPTHFVEDHLDSLVERLTATRNAIAAECEDPARRIASGNVVQLRQASPSPTYLRQYA